MQRKEKVTFFLTSYDYICELEDVSKLSGVEIEGPIGVNITALEIAGVNLTELAEKLRNDTDVDEILTRTNVSTRTLGGSFILPDYDMDIYLMMAWRDARLVNPYQKPILVKEEEILEKIWRPDPFFANAKEAEFHEVTKATLSESFIME
uniref:Neurotransmitter-gated ion-channel ligand-binding domain-containing protein n=1 Tax=Parascaris equorum TaxID=6256 RepID=A0A914RG06_PAREQ